MTYQIGEVGFCAFVDGDLIKLDIVGKMRGELLRRLRLGEDLGLTPVGVVVLTPYPEKTRPAPVGPIVAVAQRYGRPQEVVNHDTDIAWFDAWYKWELQNPLPIDQPVAP
jgi:hypothetical protein